LSLNRSSQPATEIKSTTAQVNIGRADSRPDVRRPGSDVRGVGLRIRIGIRLVPIGHPASVLGDPFCQIGGREHLYAGAPGPDEGGYLLQPGDLVFFRTGYKKRHVGIYLADGRFLHASASSGVTVSPLGRSYWQEHWWQGRRLLSLNEETPSDAPARRPAPDDQAPATAW